MLYEHGVELPSDTFGTLYAELDAGDGWKLKFARERMAAGFSVDVNKGL